MCVNVVKNVFRRRISYLAKDDQAYREEYCDTLVRCALGKLTNEERNGIEEITEDSTVDPLSVFCLVTRLRLTTVRNWLNEKHEQFSGNFRDAYELAVMLDGKDKLDRMFNGTKKQSTLRDIDPKKFATYMWYAHKIKVTEPQDRASENTPNTDALKAFEELRKKMTQE